ncbi:hypothetical protein CDD81_5397 [Ophiocordyceps australis]|uniref:Yippee domain-containing protein n=1 Tax=Ophiocordyceps australis TaxID=1399860 RepID=A0A2C5Y8S9_9HYPO|nr:hypothetical protein CDD81_5397 [Ophiocordyceps australis]
MPRDKRISATRPLFSSYLVPSFSFSPFRRRRPEACPSICSTDSNTRLTEPAKASSPRRSSKPRLARAAPDVLRCMSCAADLALASQVISKGFTGRWGRAFLVAPPPAEQTLHNVRLGPNEDRQLVTGWHVVADISCATCSRKLGWKYVDAKDAAQQYKVGNYILELARVVTHCCWEDVDVAAAAAAAAASDATVADANGPVDDYASDIVFNLDDEQECEDLFAGVWNRETVAKRRARAVLQSVPAN